ncbi:hypothetical protein GCM10016234_34660 [Tianweitania populi]|uniref:ABC transporter substrate-binding protein n=2 Tax=Tianweitania populi TaxID=1607949 RepID=A0A8J3DUE7_9HYPH|nr:hypothetical protein GCM10016234_34660 [Tianweitania populi]
MLLSATLLAFGNLPAQAQSSAVNVPVAQGSLSPSTQVWPSDPRRKADGTKWRLGYYEGGQYKDYETILKATVRGLAALGWIEPISLPSANDPQAGGFWRWLSANVKSDYIDFPADGYYASGNFDKIRRPKVRAELLQRLNERRDLDLVLALGTWAGQDLSSADLRTPVVVASTSDPVGSKIIVSEADSGHDYLNAKVEPQRYARQVELFDDIFHFKRLGLVYEDSPEGRTFAAVDDIRRLGDERSFEVVPCFAPFNDIAQEEAEAKVIACYEDIATKVDAVYITVHRGLNETSLPKALAPLTENRIPTFSMLGETEVKAGALMSVAQSDYLYVGRFHAETIAKIFNGALPRELPQIWQAPAKIALNLRTADAIGYAPSVDILLATDEIFSANQGPATAP